VSLSVQVADCSGAFALNVAFESAAGVTALFGRSGAGKTTVVQMVAGLRRPGSGRISMAGRTLFDSALGIDLPAHRRRVGLVSQEPRLFPHLSVRANLLYGRWAGRRRSATSLEAVVSLLGLEALLARRPATLSGGEAQRVAIGRALLAGPEILLMDEPLSNLDGARRAGILPYLDRLANEGGVPILYVSHAVDEVARLADTVVLLSEGKVVASGPVEEVFSRTDLGAAAGRYEAGTVVSAAVSGHDRDFALTSLSWGGAEIAVPDLDRPVGETVRLRIRARDVALALTPPANMSVRNVLAARVASVDLEPGAFAEVVLAIAKAGGAPLRARLTRKSAVELGLQPGLPVFALIKSVSVETDRKPPREGERA
jgi:molybdate transport system ATP-binding protein